MFHTADTTVVSIVHLWTIHDGHVRRVKYKGHDGRVREERPNLLMLYDTLHTKRDYKFWICHPWYTVDIAVT